MKFLMSVFCVALLASCTGTETGKENKQRIVKVYRAEASTASADREFTFISKPYKTTDLSFRVGGPVTVFDVQPGQFYKKGELIAAIDNRDFKIRKEKSEAMYHQADAEYKRISSLYEKNNVSGSSYEKAKSDFAVAKSAFESACNELNDTKLEAPFDGYVQRVNIERFQDVRASQPVISFIDLSRLKIETYIPEDIVLGMRNAPAGSEVTLIFDGIKGKEYMSSDINISRSVTDNNISFLLTAVLENRDNSLLGGMTGNLSMPSLSFSPKTSVFIPQSAVCHRPHTGAFVWILGADNCVKATPVSIGNLRRDSKIEIVSGVTAGELVVLTGHSFLADNDKVIVQQ